jgi:hypothetical protein
MSEIERHARSLNVPADEVPFVEPLPAHVPLLMEIIAALRRKVRELEEKAAKG